MKMNNPSQPSITQQPSAHTKWVLQHLSDSFHTFVTQTLPVRLLVQNVRPAPQQVHGHGHGVFILATSSKEK
jgi:hypothetical protein